MARAKTDEFVIAVAAMRRTSPPDVWAKFMSEFGKYADQRKTECVEAPLEALQRAQGRAQESSELVALFEGAVKTADRIEQRRA